MAYDEFEVLIGLNVEDAVMFCREKDVPVRIMKEDNKIMALTFDYISDRVNLELKKGKVVKYTRG